MLARQQGKTPDDASEAARRNLEDVKHVTAL
jgi:hypothetical protein